MSMASKDAFECILAYVEQYLIQEDVELLNYIADVCKDVLEDM